MLCILFCLMTRKETKGNVPCIFVIAYPLKVVFVV